MVTRSSKGYGGRDKLYGSYGNEVLRGGSGTEKFVFSNGQDIIRDFRDNVDTIAIKASAINGVVSTIDDLMVMGEIINGDAVFDLAGSRQLIIEYVPDLDVFVNDLMIV